LIANEFNHDTTIVLKVDENGEVVTANQLSSVFEGFTSRSIKALNDGTFLILASSRKPYSFYSPSVPTIVKIDSLANKIWETQIPLAADTVSNYFAHDAIFASNGNIILSGRYANSSTFVEGLFLAELSSQGDTIWRKEFLNLPGTVGEYSIGHLVVEDNNLALISSMSPGIRLIKTDSVGNLLLDKNFNDSLFELSSLNFVPDDEGILIVGKKQYPLPQPTIAYALKINNYGEKIWEIDFDNLPLSKFTGVTSAIDGGYYLYGFQEINENSNLILVKMNTNGIISWIKFYDINAYDYSDDIIQISDGSIRITGNIGDNNSQSFLAKITPNGILFSSALTGRTHLDPQTDCLPDPTEPGLANCLVQAQGAFSFATLTDSSGYFTLPIDTGSYQVTVTPPGPYWEVCNSPATVSVAAFYDTTTLDFPVSAMVDCPYLEVDISVPFLRRCFENTYSVHYCNYGTVAAEDAYVEVTLDPYLTYQSSTIPFSTQSGNTLSFDLGDVAVNECGSFLITALLDCDSTIIGQTHCTEAHVFPDSLCLPTSPQWDGSSIELSVDCAGDSVIFTITNTGTGDMAQPLDYIIIEDQIVLLQGNFDLGAGESMTVAVEANGTTFHLEAQQSPVHPSGTFSVGSTIEGCGGWLSLGFFSQWANGNPNPFVDVDCQANIGSYDPNDKVAFPAGFTEEHLIEPGQDIEYLLRFQNTGTDTAFKVVVVDVLPPELDLATLRPGASSHPYSYSVTLEGWPVFTFENIMLPDSNVNEAASHGFVRFKISQKEALAWGSEILNTALIYFDFNAPIRTNTTLHRIGQVFPWSPVGTKTVLQQKATFRILPNPLTDSAILQVEGVEPGALRLTLTDVSGQVLRVQESSGTSFEFFRNDLPSGLYFFKIEKEGTWIGSGKLMVR
jgi:uncharacterized repeat protein (TIGR01451 family)